MLPPIVFLPIGIFLGRVARASSDEPPFTDPPQFLAGLKSVRPFSANHHFA